MHRLIQQHKSLDLNILMGINNMTLFYNGHPLYFTEAKFPSYFDNRFSSYFTSYVYFSELRNTIKSVDPLFTWSLLVNGKEAYNVIKMLALYHLN